MTTQLTVLNMMASSDFDESVSRHAQWGLTWMDLWGEIYGCPSVDLLDEPTAKRAAATIEQAGLRVYCLSTRIFDGHVEIGEEAFRAEHLGQLKKSLALAAIVKPSIVRLIAARVTKADVDANAIELLKADYPWVANVYREAVNLIVDAGYAATIENETTECILASADEFLDFFAWLDLGDKVTLTWDVQNNWQMGVFPSLATYRQLKPLIRYVHLKGGQSNEGSDELAWSVGLADASWPVLEITQAVVDDDISPVICLNPSHGARKPDYDYGPQSSPRDFFAVTQRDLEFLRTNVKGIV
ncbi:MAG: sugar phosphate isomerase/epimerase [Glaciihabitans sp.]|jgi:sugar phosphate isomerase/epimerase|nr:sugar phosphate isomerase/epimerase [Glaciihabitans sp.]MDQ1571172.1 hypothetical protein [Actinomycetota bacterium]